VVSIRRYEMARNFPYLNKIPGLERMDVSAEDFVPRRGRTLVAWAVAFFALAAASGIAAWGGAFRSQSALLFELFFVLFAGLGLISLLASFTESPTA
jgi:hypothetical protein